MKTKPDFFESLFNTVGGGVAVANIEGLIQFVNPGICKMLGYSQEEFQGIHVNEITAPDDIESTAQAIKEAVKNPGYEVQLEKVYLKKDGNRFYGLTTIKSYEHEGKLFLSAYINDFAEHYLARQRTEKQYKDIIELADDIIFTVDPSGNFVYANQMAQDITGSSEKEILTRNYMDLVTPSHKKGVYKIYHEHFLSRNDSIQFTFPIQDADGGVCWLDQKLNTIWDTGRKKIIGYSAVARNVTSQRETALKLQESEVHYQTVFDQSPIPKRLEDFSLVKKYIDNLKLEGVVDFKKYFKDNPKETKKCVNLVKTIEINKQGLALHGLESEGELGGDISQLFTEQTYNTFTEELVAISQGLTLLEAITVVRTVKGAERQVELKWMVMPGYENTLEKVMITTVDITETVLNAVALQSSESHYQALFNDSPVPLWLEDLSDIMKRISELKAEGIQDFRKYFDENFEEVISLSQKIKVLQVNQQVLSLHQASSYDELLSNFPKIFTEDAISAFKDELVHLIEKTSSSGIDCKMKTIYGKEIVVNMQWSLMPGHEDKYDKVFVSTLDITDQYNSLSEIKKSEKRLSTVFRNLGIPIIISDPNDGSLVDVNEVAVEALGFSKEELLHMSIADLDSTHDKAYVIKALKRCYDEGFVQGVSKWKTKSGQVRDISIKNSLVKIGGEDRILSACTDITELKKLNIENEIFRNVMDNAPFAIYIANQDGKIIDVNNTASEQLGFSKQELTGLSLKDIEAAVDKNEFSNNDVSFQEVIDERMNININTHHKRKDKSVFPVNVTITGGEISGEGYVVASVFDNTVANERVGKIEEQNEVLKIIQSLQSEFISGANLRHQFVGFLDSLISYTNSAFGFIGEIKKDNEVPYLKTHAMTEISWDGETKKLYGKTNKEGFEFRNLNTLFGVTISTGEVCISNDPKNDPRSGGVPKGHPTLHRYIGIPIIANKELIGMVGLANRKEDYSLHMLDQLKYFISTYSVMVQALRTQEDKANTQKKLERVNKALSEEIQFRKVIQKHSLDAEERERKRVARDLHDGLGQRLTAVKLSLGAIKNGKELSGHPADILNETIKLVEGSMGEVRTISQNILPVVLSDFGLSEGLKKACEQVSESGSVLVNFKTEGESNDMEDFVKISLYRIGQECINNAIKYSKSDVIDVRVMHCSNQKYVQVRVRDYGIGFDPKKVKKGMGLNNIKERTEMIKGELLIKSKLNIGTTIQVKYLF